jgi:hypothetical protein
MAPVRVEGLGAGHREHDATQRQEAGDAVVDQESDSPDRREPLDHRRVLDQLVETEQRERHEPDEDHRSEQPADRAGPVPLQEEERDQDRY